MAAKIWANSGDSHFLEPEDLWRASLPPRLAELMPHAVKDPDGEWETVYIDGMAFRRKLPTSAVAKEFMEATHRAPGARSPRTASWSAQCCASRSSRGTRSSARS